MRYEIISRGRNDKLLLNCLVTKSLVRTVGEPAARESKCSGQDSQWQKRCLLCDDGSKIAAGYLDLEIGLWLGISFISRCREYKARLTLFEYRVNKRSWFPLHRGRGGGAELMVWELYLTPNPEQSPNALWALGHCSGRRGAELLQPNLLNQRTKIRAIGLKL